MRDNYNTDEKAKEKDLSEQVSGEERISAASSDGQLEKTSPQGEGTGVQGLPPQGNALSQEQAGQTGDGKHQEDANPEDFDENLVKGDSGEGKRNKNNKPKKPPMSKKKKITLGIISGVVAALLIAVMVFVIIFLTLDSPPTPFDQSNAIVDMGSDYYAGTEGAYDKNLSTGKKVTTIAGAYNVGTYEEFYQRLKEGRDVVVHAKDLVMTNELGTIELKSSVYGNGVSIDANQVVYGTLKPNNPGKQAFLVNGNTKKITFRDVKVYGKKMEAADTLKAFNNYGELMLIMGEVERKAHIDIIHCVLENSHKIIHIIAGNVNIEGTIVRNASDTAISIGTFPEKASNVGLKNNLIADSLAGGIVIYSYDQLLSAAHDNEKTWNKINIEGFLDIYNWKKASELTFIPDTEIDPIVANGINQYLATEIVKEKYLNMRVDSGEEKYVHFGIIKIATNKFGKNKSQLTFNGEALKEKNSLGYRMETFPIPSIGQAFLKEIFLIGYYDNNDGAVKFDAKLNDNQNIYKELREGRK